MATAMCRCLLGLQNFKFNRLMQKYDRPSSIISSSFCTDVETEYYDDDEVKRLRDVSRLPHRLKRKVHNIMPNLDPATDDKKVYKIKKELRENKYRHNKLFAEFGFKSGVDPRTLWPTREELRRTKELEERFEPPLQEKLAEVQRVKMERERIDRERVETVTKCMEKMPNLIKTYQAGFEKERNITDVNKAKREAMLRETRDELGLYSVDIYDKRISMRLEFKQQLEKIDANRKKKRERKGQEKEEKIG